MGKIPESNNFTREELDIINRCNTPKKVNEWFQNEIAYNYETDGETLQSFRRVVRNRNAHCLEGAVTAASILSQHGYTPEIVCIESPFIDHNIFVYKTEKNRIGSVAWSRFSSGYDRPPVYKTIKDLVLSYGSLLDVRGWAVLNLNKFKNINWITSEEDLWIIENVLYKIKYHAVRHNDGKEFYLSPDKDGKRLIWV